MNPDPKKGAQKINEKREELEELADSELSPAWVAELLLEAADEQLDQ